METLSQASTVSLLKIKKSWELAKFWVKCHETNFWSSILIFKNFNGFQTLIVLKLTVSISGQYVISLKMNKICTFIALMRWLSSLMSNITRSDIGAHKCCSDAEWLIGFPENVDSNKNKRLKDTIVSYYGY